jgi:hypothetical protein
VLVLNTQGQGVGASVPRRALLLGPRGARIEGGMAVLSAEGRSAGEQGAADEPPCRHAAMSLDGLAATCA